MSYRYLYQSESSNSFLLLFAAGLGLLETEKSSSSSPNILFFLAGLALAEGLLAGNASYTSSSKRFFFLIAGATGTGFAACFTG